MSNRLKFIAAFSLGVMMTCTLVKAEAADYRKEKNVKLSFGDAASVVTYKLHAANYDLCSFLVPDNHVVFTNKVTYLFPVNEPKPENTNINGLINDRREQERISIGLNL